MEQLCKKVLIIDDDEDDFILARDILSRIAGAIPEVEWASSYSAALSIIERGEHDVFLVDYRLGGQNGLELIRTARQRGVRQPMILLTGQGDLDADMRAVRDGASDYLLKDEINPLLLERSIRYSMDRQRAQNDLKESEEKYRALSENSPDIIMRFDCQYRHLYVNSAVRAISKVASHEFIGKTHAELGFPEQMQEFWRKHLGSAFGSGKPQRVEFEYRTEEGLHVFDMRLMPEQSTGCEVTSVMCTMRDITEIKRLQQFTARAQRLETAGRIAGQVAHDFNNLLAPLVAYPDLMRGELPPGLEAVRFLDKMKDAACRMSEINQQLLTLGRRGHYNMEPLSLNEIVRQAVGQTGTTAVAPAMQLNLQEGLMNIKAGPSQILRAITNLINNACDAMPNGGQLTITTENVYVDDETVGRLGRIPIGEYVRLTVSDTGVGIDPDALPRIFDPFFTTKTTDRARGSGLGLSVVHAVVEDHHGAVECKSTPGKGTTMIIYFPITREAVEVKQWDQIIGGCEKIMVVDDDEVQREVCQQLLEKLGYQVTAVSSGELAVDTLITTPHDLLLLDMIMPGGIDGTETLKRVLEVHPEQRAIVVSGYAESRRVSEALRLGASAFIRKPVTMRSIAQAVRRELDRNIAPVVV